MILVLTFGAYSDKINMNTKKIGDCAVKKCENFEPYQYSVTDKSRGTKMPSYNRVTVAVTVTVVIMVVCAVIISVVRAKYAVAEQYYGVGNAEESAPIYEEPDLYGGFTVIGEPITVLEFTEVVERGDRATLRIHGKPNTEYGITVYLKSGPSTNSALVSKLSDEHGIVEWNWKVYKGTATGKFKIVIKSIIDDSEYTTYAEMYFTITDKE